MDISVFTAIKSCSVSGINVRGRRSKKKLKINYRTTEETRQFAVGLLTGVKVDNLDGETDSCNDYLSFASW